MKGGRHVLKLNDLYDGATFLRDWWKTVKSNFAEISQAHNALEEALGEESTQRESGDNALSARINSEESARKNADNNIRQSITEKAAQLQSDISTETTSRKNADAQLSTQISAETAARQNADRNLKSNIDTLTGKAHTHENAAVLSGISVEDVAAWRDRTDYDKDNGIMIGYLLDMLIGQVRDMKELYGAAGVTLYDGGIFEDEYVENSALDGGEFNSDELEPFDCSEFGTNIVANAAVLDGGRY